MALADYIEHKPVIDAARLRLRPLCPDDIPALKEWTPDKSIYAYWGKSPGKTDKNPELLFQKPEKPSKSFHLGVGENHRRYLGVPYRKRPYGLRRYPYRARLSGQGLRNGNAVGYDPLLLRAYGVTEALGKS